MGSLGDLGQVKVREETSFGWFGHTIRANPNLTDIVLMDFAEEAAAIDEDSPEAMTFIKRQMRLAIHHEDFAVFWSAAIENGQDTVDMMSVMKALIESSARRPTVLPSASSAGQPRTVVTSPDVSSLPATEASPLRAADLAVVEQMSGRPDLQGVVVEMARQRAV